MRRTVLLPLAFVLTLCALAPAPCAGEDAPAWRRLTLGEGTPWATPAWDGRGAEPGPTVVVTAGIHGNEVASTYAADQIRQWPLRRGRLLVIPFANRQALQTFRRTTPDVEDGLGDLNRNFPRAGKKEDARGPRAQALWHLVRESEPDWLIDLHEGKDFHQVNGESVGSSVITTNSEEARAAAALLLDAVNVTIPAGTRRFVKIQLAVDGSLARAAADHLSAHSLILETTWTQPRSLRARQHRLMVHRLLLHLGMIRHDLPVDTLADAHAHANKTIVAVYDATGTGGKGVARLWRQFRRRRDLQLLRIGPADVRGGALAAVDVVVFPGGTGSGQAKALGSAGREALRRFVERGGGYVGICAGAYLACSSFAWGLKVLNARTVSPKWKRGTATLDVELTARGREILGATDGMLSLLFNNGPVLAPDEVAELPDFETLAVFRTEVAANGTPKGVQVGTPAIACGRCGEGRVIVFSPHPEQSEGMGHLVDRAIDWVAGGRVSRILAPRQHR